MCLLYAPRVRLPVRHNQELFDIWGGALARVRMCLSSRGGRGIPSMGSGARVLANAKFGQQCEERLDPDATDRGAGGVILKIADHKTKMKHCPTRKITNLDRIWKMAKKRILKKNQSLTAPRCLRT